MVESLKLKSMSMPMVSSTHPHNHQSSNNNNSNNDFLSPRDLQDSATASASSIDFDAYEQYLRLPALSNLWTSEHFPEWKNESILKPSLQALEITFRLISIALSDPRPYSNHRQWKLRLESLASRQIEIIALLCTTHHNNNNNNNINVPIANLTSPDGVIPRHKSSHEVWNLSTTTTSSTSNSNHSNSSVVCHTSEGSLLPRLAAWEKSQEVATKILFQIESQMHGCPFTLGLGEPNLNGKPCLDYDHVVQPSNLHSLNIKIKANSDPSSNHEKENQKLFTIHQIIESWLRTAQQLLHRIGDRVDGDEFEDAANDCWVLERIWILLVDIEDLHLLMDPDDFLHLKTRLGLGTKGECAAAALTCFKSRRLISVTNSSKDLLKQKVPRIVGVEADPNGGPRVQEAAMKLFHSRTRGGENNSSARIHLLQAFQAIEVAVKRFYFAYRQLVMAVMGSLEANSYTSASDSLSQMFMDPPYFPSLDAAKTFLGELWRLRQPPTS